jgi:hypothetical protein
MPSPTIAVAHYPEGAGHATRMVAVARALERRGTDVELAGGGDGSRFVALNGYDAFEPTPVDYIDTYQGGSPLRTLTQSVPASADRVRDYRRWLRDVDPDALVTDDMFAVVAAVATDVPLYAIKHDLPAVYDDPVERAGAALHTRLQLRAARDLFTPVVWDPRETDPEGATPVAPLALDGEGEAGDHDVLVVPSRFSSLERAAEELDARGHDVCHVGGDDWTPVRSLLPHVRAADAVVCSGYSTAMEAAVAGTPCVVRPATDEQVGVARRLDAVPGFDVATTTGGAVDAVAAADPDDALARPNGASTVADRVLADLDGPAARSPDDPRRASGAMLRRVVATVGGSR